MLTNMESQLKEQGAADRLDEVLTEIPKVREDLGFIPLVTPTSQIVGTQAVLNVLTGERYKSITKETAGVLKGEYGATPHEVNAALQERVLDGGQAITCRPADVLQPEMDNLTQELKSLVAEKNITLADDEIDDVLTYALFPQIGLKFLENRNNPSVFEPEPSIEDAVEQKVTKANTQTSVGQPENYSVSVDGKVYEVVVAPSGAISSVNASATDVLPQSTSVAASESLNAPLAGNIFKVLVNQGDVVKAGDVVIVMEAMKMETEIRATSDGEILQVYAKEGDSVAVGEPLLALV